VRVHFVAPTPHRDMINPWEPDAYVGKALRLCRMLTGLGHEVYLYSGPENDAPVTGHITVVTAEDRARWFGDTDWETTVFNEFDPVSSPWMTMNSRTVVAMQQIIEPTDIIFLTMGSAQAPIQQAFPNHVVAECGVGYEGVLGNTQRCFESYAWMHYIWGKTGVVDGRYYDTVIPNSFDPADYRFEADKGDYLLFMGRLTERKGLEVVRELSKQYMVITAGQGEPLDGIQHRGVVRGAEKAALLAGARAVLVPTTYVPPFEGVNVEAQLCGTPVITSPFGCFAETVNHGISGFRCHTLAECRDAAEAVDDLDPKTVREWALSRFTLEVCAPQYDRWLNQLSGLYGRGWYS
jgi:hypothetical protein